MADRTDKKVGLRLIPASAIQQRILVVRERQVVLDEDLTELYGVETRRLIEQVKRNVERFPADFMFQLTKDEAAALRSQTATPGGRGGRRYAPYVFTEQDVCDALGRTSQQAGGRRQHGDHAGVRRIASGSDFLHRD